MNNFAKRKIICAAVCVSLAGGLFIPEVAAVAPSYTVGKYYEGTKFYERLLAVELTGDQREGLTTAQLLELFKTHASRSLETDRILFSAE